LNVNHSNNSIKRINEENKNNIRLVEEIDFFGIDVKILVTGDMTDNKYSLTELSFPAGSKKEVALHKHSKEDVTVCVMEGNFVFRYGNKELKKGFGEDDTPFRLEKNIAHSYKKIGDERGVLLMLFRPAGFENFFRDLGRSLGMSITEEKTDENKLPNGKMEDDDRVLLHLLEKKYGGRFMFEQDE
jgi:quercetin dioxygenase-like cupin family protein